MEDLRKEVQELRERVERLEKMQARQASTYTSPYIPPTPVKHSKKRRLTEIFWGTYGLSILATILILAGIGLLSYMTWNWIPNAGKSISILCFAGAIAGIGVIKKKSVFKDTLMGLSFAIMYLDIVITHWIWKLIPQFLVFVCIGLWCLFGVLVARWLKEKFYYFIVFLGLFITVCIASEVNVCLFIVAFWVLSLAYWKEYQRGHEWIGICGAAMFFVMGPTSLWMDEFLSSISIRLLIILFGLSLIFGRKWIWDRNVKWMQIFMTTAVVVGYLGISRDWNGFVLECIPITIVLLWGMYQTEGIPIAIIASLGTIFAGSYLDIGFSYCYVVLFLCLSYASGLYAKKNHYYITSCILDVYATFQLFRCSHGYFREADVLLLGISLILINVMLFLTQRLQNKWVMSCSMSALYISILSIGYVLSPDQNASRWNLFPVCWSRYAYWATAAVLIYMIMAYFRRKSITVWDIVHSIFINLYLSIALLVHEEHVLIIGMLLQLAFLIFWSIKKSAVYEIGCSIFVTWNLSVMYWSSPFEDITIMYSITLLMMAAGFIFYGGIKQRKPYRLYGLIIMFLSVAKMVFIDIQGQSSIVKVISLILGGIVCLLISYGYNRLESRWESGT